MDPRKAILELDQVIPKDWDVVIGGGHYFSIALTHLERPGAREVSRRRRLRRHRFGPASRDRRGRGAG